MKYVVTKKDFEIMTAWDLMTPEPYSINIEQNVEGIFRILEDKKISAIPVVNDKRQLIGVISQTDLLKFLYKKIDSASKVVASFQGADLDLPLSEVLPEFLKLKEFKSVSVKELMTKFVYSVNVNANANGIMKEMQEKKIHRMYVLDNTGILIGVITTLDIFKRLTE